MDQIHRRPMTGKTVLVTGGTSGIGKATALGLAAHGCAGRRSPAGIVTVPRTAAGEIRAAGGGQVDVFVADLSSQAEVRRLAAEVLQRLPRIDVLINNVGGYWNTRHVTADGLERTFALNHLAPFLLTNLLLDRLDDRAPRHGWSRSRPTRRPWGGSTSTISRGNSPTRAHGPMTSPSSPTCCSPTSWPGGCTAALVPVNAVVTANALHPGVVNTSFGAEDPASVQRVFVPFLRPLMKTPAQGAATSIQLASAPELSQVTGQYFANSKPKKSSQRSYDEADCRATLAGQRRPGRPDRGRPTATTTRSTRN